MRKHSFLRGLTAFTLAGLLAFYSGVVQLPNVSAESITDLKSQLAELEKQEEENNKRLEELRDDVSQKRAYRDELQGKIDIIQQQLAISCSPCSSWMRRSNKASRILPTHASASTQIIRS